jgi:hypothetical protein
MASDRSTPERRALPLAAIVVTVTAGLFVWACFLPALDCGTLEGGALTDGPAGPHQPPIVFHGWEVLKLAWFVIPFGSLAWLSNFVLAAGMVYALLGSQKRAATLGLTAALLCQFAWAGCASQTPCAGFYLWMGSLCFFAIGEIAIWKRFQTREKTPGD